MNKQIDDTQTVHINAWEEETKVEVLQWEPGEATFLSRGEKCSPCDHSLLAKAQGPRLQAKACIHTATEHLHSSTRSPAERFTHIL
jgi:hypothetical protein